MALTTEQFTEAVNMIMNSPETMNQISAGAANLRAGQDAEFGKAMETFATMDFSKLPDGLQKIARDTIVATAQELAQLAQAAPEDAKNVAGLPAGLANATLQAKQKSRDDYSWVKMPS